MIKNLNKAFGKTGVDTAQLSTITKSYSKLFKTLSTMANIPSYATDALFIWDTFKAPDGQCFTFQSDKCEIGTPEHCTNEPDCLGAEGHWWSDDTCANQPGSSGSFANPTIDPAFECESDYYWSASSTDIEGTEYAWQVYFYNGHTEAYFPSYKNYARCIR